LGYQFSTDFVGDHSTQPEQSPSRYVSVGVDRSRNPARIKRELCRVRMRSPQMSLIGGRTKAMPTSSLATRRAVALLW